MGKRRKLITPEDRLFFGGFTVVPISESLHIGDRVYIQGDHPHSGKEGVYSEDYETMFGIRPVVRLDDGESCFIFNPTHWRKTNG